MVVRFLFINLIIGLVSFPVSYLLFKKLTDKGYAVGHLLGWFSVSYISYTLSHLGIPVYYSIYISALGWIGVNAYIEYKQRIFRKFLSKGNVLTTELIFLMFFAVLYFIRIGSFTLNTIERTPDFAVIKSLFNTVTLPPTDVWLTGKPINYYYFGHYTVFTMLSFAGLDPAKGFLYVVAWMFGIYAVCLFKFGSNLYEFLVSEFMEGWHGNNFLSALSGAFSVFLVLFAGNLFSVKFLWLKDFSYWTPTRFVPGTIMEIPLFSFLVADLHGHMWGMGIGITILFTLLAFWFDKTDRPLVKNYYVYLLSFLLGLTVITNTWDILSLGLLAGAGVLLKYEKKIRFSKDFPAVLANLAIVALIPLAWLTYYRQEGSGGLGLTHGGSGIVNLLMHWGGFAFPLAVFLTLYSVFHKKKLDFVWLITLVSLLLIIFAENFFIKDIMSGGEFKRANTVFKIYMQVWLWLGALMGPVLVLLLSPTAKVKKFLEGKIFTFQFLILLFISVLLVYPSNTLKQTVVPDYSRSVDKGMSFFYDQYPQDYQAYLFLKNIQEQLPRSQKKKVIVEAPGDSFADTSLFSSYLGWPTLVGWSGHVWTYRGTYKYNEARVAELNEIYSGSDILLTKQILDKYKVNYIIVGTDEKKKYPNIQLDKLLILGNKIYDKGGVSVIAYQ